MTGSGSVTGTSLRQTPGEPTGRRTRCPTGLTSFSLLKSDLSCCLTVFTSPAPNYGIQDGSYAVRASVSTFDSLAGDPSRSWSPRPA